MKAPSSWLAPLRWLLWATFASSILHYVDNVLMFEQYPEPPWINRHIVDAFWWLMTPLAWFGYRLMRNGALRAGTVMLLLYAACNLLTLGHYRYAPMDEISPRIHAFIGLEAVLAMALITLLFMLCATRNTRKAPSPPLDEKSRSALIAANIAMLLAITIHDADHIRQASEWCYTITTTLWIINVAVYLPSAGALTLSLRGSRFAAWATSTGALLIAILFAKVHLWKPTFNAWGIWNKSFIELGADWISWAILTLLVLVGIAAAMTGTWAMGRLSPIQKVDAR
ncbi:hypothetical protein [Roseateles sp. BYS96W]|uniref:Uncharacterized protein n=1 Tax=Pelomonas nitida TaxID=3299027 RepID=A0ABW7G1G0_9BURK